MSGKKNSKRNVKKTPKKSPFSRALPYIIAAAAVIAILCIILIPKGDSKSSAGVCYADIEIENYGTVTVKLNGDAAPITVKNFIDLAEDGFYDGLTFHRIMNGFMMQGGDPEANGTGGSGKTIKGEFSANGVDNPLSHTRGAVSMARAKAMDSASSQFFIVQQDSTYLDGQYAAFGYVTSGMDIVDKICADAKPIDNNGLIASDEQPVIRTITIRK